MANQFENFTIYQILRYDAILQEITHCPMLATPFYRSIFDSCANTCGFYHKSQRRWSNGNAEMGTNDWRPSFDTLVKKGFIEVVETETYNVYVDANSSYYDPEVIDMTDEQYNNLPQFFKDKVEIQPRKRNIYKINPFTIKELMSLAEVLHLYFN